MGLFYLYLGFGMSQLGIVIGGLHTMNYSGMFIGWGIGTLLALSILVIDYTHNREGANK